MSKTFIRLLLPFLSALIVISGALLLGGQHYTAASALLAAAALFGFTRSFENRSLSSRYAVLTAVMTALSVIGRFIFAPVPAFKPMTAIVILSGVYLTPECGFVTGAMTALISNMYFGHGAWTPFQMLAWGLIGIVSGCCSKLLRQKKLLLLMYGAIAGALYSLVMDVWTVMWFNDGMDSEMYGAAIISALPFTAAYAVSNVIFLWLTADSFGRKLSRAVTLIER